MIWGGGWNLSGSTRKNNNLGNIHRNKNKSTKTGDASKKKSRNDNFLLMHPPENEDDKGLPDILALNSCTAYMENLKIMLIDKFRENEPPIVFHRDHWSRILNAILAMKTIYCRKNNIRLVNTKQRAGQ